MPIRRIRAASPIAVAVAVGACVVLVNAAAEPDSGPATPPTTRELVGQRFMVAMHGAQPSPALLGRVRRGEIGGVILFGANITSRAQLRSLTARLQQTARAAGRPPLLIATDQEGGQRAARPVGRPRAVGVRARAPQRGAHPQRGPASRGWLFGRAESTSISPPSQMFRRGLVHGRREPHVFGRRGSRLARRDGVRERARRRKGGRHGKALPRDRLGRSQHRPHGGRRSPAAERLSRPGSSRSGPRSARVCRS